jgi:ribosome biogenesis GTPase A
VHLVEEMATQTRVRYVPTCGLANIGYSSTLNFIMSGALRVVEEKSKNALVKGQMTRVQNVKLLQ